jgi:hypothetical protein
MIGAVQDMGKPIILRRVAPVHLIAHLLQQNLISPPGWLADNAHYLTIMGQRGLHL